MCTTQEANDRFHCGLKKFKNNFGILLEYGKKYQNTHIITYIFVLNDWKAKQQSFSELSELFLHVLYYTF